jgi:ligand-binding sensor domain-containing protein
MKYAAALTLILSIAMQGWSQSKVDSIVYDTGGMEWKMFDSKGPVLAFAVQGNQLWYATADNVARVNISTGKFDQYQKVGELSASGVTAMGQGAGDVWIGTDQGVVLRTGGRFRTFTADNGLPGNSVNAIYGTRDGAVWVGTDSGVGVYKNGSWKSYTTADGLVGNTVKAIVADHRGAVWLGTKKGISVFNNGQWTSHTMKSGLSWNDTKALAFDPRTKMIWAAVGDADVNRWDGKSWKVYMTIHEGICTIMADSQSRIWFGSPTGLLKFNGDAWISDPKKLGVPAAMVPQLYRDANKNLWFASENGVIFMNNPYFY